MSETEIVFGKARAFRRVVEQADKYSRAAWPVLILGETGVGKELFARRIHRGSGRKADRFVPVNCGALPAGLFESELFGHERGAFSGASQGSRGLVRMAHAGTLFLDEIGELDLASQVKLLRFLDSGELRAVGATRWEKADTRIVAATNVDLSGAVQRGRFRQDLLQRLGVLILRVPPLRERPEDIVDIARDWLDRIGCGYEASELEVLCQYDWPGNVRQLKNFLIRASLLGEKRVRAPQWQNYLEQERWANPPPARSVPEMFDGSLADIEKKVIVGRLRRCRGNRKQTAKELGIAKSTLHEKLRRWNQESLSQNRDPWDAVSSEASGCGGADDGRLFLCPALPGGSGAA